MKDQIGYGNTMNDTGKQMLTEANSIRLIGADFVSLTYFHPNVWYCTTMKQDRLKSQKPLVSSGDTAREALHNAAHKTGYGHVD